MSGKAYYDTTQPVLQLDPQQMIHNVFMATLYQIMGFEAFEEVLASMRDKATEDNLPQQVALIGSDQYYVRYDSIQLMQQGEMKEYTVPTWGVCYSHEDIDDWLDNPANEDFPEDRKDIIKEIYELATQESYLFALENSVKGQELTLVPCCTVWPITEEQYDEGFANGWHMSAETEKSIDDSTAAALKELGREAEAKEYALNAEFQQAKNEEGR